MTQLSFATLDHRNKKKQTKREGFLGETTLEVRLIDGAKAQPAATRT